MLSKSSTKADLLQRTRDAFSIIPGKINHLWIGLSGGLDSCILLHVITQLFPDRPCTAIHIHHGLQQDSVKWIQYCHQLCSQRNVPLVTESVFESLSQYQAAGDSLEEAARKARYNVFQRFVKREDSLLTGHHFEDQAETVLLQLMRGAGIQGLSGMRLLTPLGMGYHLRPLLSWTKQERLTYAKQHQLTWIEDPSNQNQVFQRNFIRHTVLPLLQKTWKHPIHSLVRTATHCREATELCLDVAKTDLVSCEVQSDQLALKKLLALPRLRRRNVLRYWLMREIGQSVHTAHFEHIESLLYSEADRNSCFQTKLVRIKRYRNYLYLFKLQKSFNSKNKVPITWDVRTPLELNNWGSISLVACQGKGIRPNIFCNHRQLKVRYRTGGERFHPKDRVGSHPLKKLFQEWNIPPWEREQWPLIYFHNQLIAVPNYAISKEVSVSTNDVGLWIQATRSTKTND